MTVPQGWGFVTCISGNPTAAIFPIVSVTVKWSCRFKAITFPVLVKDCGGYSPPLALTLHDAVRLTIQRCCGSH